MPRSSHAGWKPDKDRLDPVDLTLASNKGRMANLLPIRHGRMSASPFAFFRGSAALMAAEKNLPWGRRLATPIGVALLTGSAAIVIVNTLV